MRDEGQDIRMTETVNGTAQSTGAGTSGTKPNARLRVERVFTSPGAHPYDEVSWERRDVVMTNWRDGTVNFEQRGVEFPDFWSVNAANIVTTKYFRGAVDTEQRESSLRQLIDRVVGKYVEAAREHGYFARDEDATAFEHELTWMLLHQVFSFNSPVWFNVGTSSPQQVSACFILAVDDQMDSILNWYREEGLIFKGGSGAGLNLSRIRSSKELLSSGGTASGPVSFMRGADASAGTIKSGGATRRAAKMVVLDVDHPDIEEFIETKAREEDKIRALRDAGFDMDLGGKDIVSVQYQNANNSVRVTDEFMRAVEEGAEFNLRGRLDGRVIETVDARTLWGKLAQAAWECADPGIQYDDTINDWHTNPETGRITASNPCFPADQRVVTDKGLIRIGDLVGRAAVGESFDVYTNDVTSTGVPADRIVATSPTRYMVTGRNEVIELRFTDGSRLRCTPGHRLWTANRGWVHAEDLSSADRVVRSIHHAARPHASRALPASALDAAAGIQGERPLVLPEKWDRELGHYLGWLVGAGDISGTQVGTAYGAGEDARTLLAPHRVLLERFTGVRGLGTERPDGSCQLTAAAPALVRFIRALGVDGGPARAVPDAVFEAPEDALVAFLRGLFDADGRVEAGRVVLGARGEQVALDVQELLAGLGIASAVAPVADGFELTVAARSLAAYADQVGFTLPSRLTALAQALAGAEAAGGDDTVAMTDRSSTGFETTYNLTEPRNHSYIVSGVVIANCSEYMSLDNSSCNLASLNLMKFLRDDGTFDAKLFAKSVELIITAMDISICFADFPTEPIAATTRAYRQLGIGFANLGALLMATGHAYDSDGGRALAAAITSLMTGTAYKRSAELAAIVGPYDGYARNAEPHKRVMRKHAAANDAVRTVGADDARILHEATNAWRDCLSLGEKNGYRNAQASVIAPTGTIGLMMDCDTTGLEPDLALVKFKKLVGGASMQIVNGTVPRALRSLGYQEESVEAIVEHVAEKGNVVDAPGLRPEHYSVFDCAMGDRSISPMGHVRMMAAIQPFVSGALSKTVNLPAEATVEDVANVYLQGWKLGLKALAIYRNNSKVGQPLTDKKQKSDAAAEPVAESRPVRKRLPKRRPSQTVSFSVAGAEGYMTAGSYPDDGLGEVFIKMSKQGSTLAGVMDAFSVAISIGLQYGVPLEAFVSKFTNMRFDPAGMTDDPDVRIAQSVMDYLFRRLALDYLPYEKRAELGIFSAEERTATVASTYGSAPVIEEELDVEGLAQGVPLEKPVAAIAPAPAGVGSSMELLEKMLGTAADAPLCLTCGTKMRPAGSCYLCEGCGSTSGCS